MHASECLFCIHWRPGSMDNELEKLLFFQQYFRKYATSYSASAHVSCIKIHAEMT